MTSSASYCTTADIDPTVANPGSPCKGVTGAPAPDPYGYTGGSVEGMLGLLSWLG